MKLYRIENYLKPRKYLTNFIKKQISNTKKDSSDKLKQGTPSTVDDYQDHTPFKTNSPNSRIDPTRHNENLKNDPILEAYKIKQEKLTSTNLNYTRPDYIPDNMEEIIRDDKTENLQDLDAEDKEYPNTRHQDSNEIDTKKK